MEKINDFLNHFPKVDYLSFHSEIYFKKIIDEVIVKESNLQGLHNFSRINHFEFGHELIDNSLNSIIIKRNNVKIIVSLY